jgi:hypothetical protein
MAKRGNGAGSVYHRKSDNKWVGSISLENGKRKVFYGKTQKEVQDKVNEALYQQQKGMLITAPNEPLKVYLERWLEIVCMPPNWLCCKKCGRDALDVKAHLLFSLGGHSKQAGDERNLILDVSLPHPSDLSLPDHVHDLVPLERSPGRFHGKEAHPWLGQSFDKAVILLDQVIQVFDLPEFDLLGKGSSGFEVGNGLGIGRILIDINHTRNRRGGGISRSSGLFHLLFDRTSLRS